MERRRFLLLPPSGMLFEPAITTSLELLRYAMMLSSLLTRNSTSSVPDGGTALFASARMYL